MTLRTWATPLVWIAFICLSLAGCGSSPTTPVGALGNAADLRPELPPEVAQHFPTDAGAKTYTTTQQVCEPPGRVQLNWRAVTDGDTSYVVSVDVAVVEPAPNFVLVLGKPFVGGSEEAAPTAKTAHVSIKCTRNTSSSVIEQPYPFVLRADGTSRKGN